MKTFKAKSKRTSNESKTYRRFELSKKIRFVLNTIATIVGIVSFIGMISVDDNASMWFSLEAICLTLFILSFVINAIACDPNLLIRHLFAILMCNLAFAYRRLHIRNEVTHECNRLRRKLDGYPQLYLKALEIYDDKLYKDFDSYGEDNYE